jgi:hypothetical protein
MPQPKRTSAVRSSAAASLPIFRTVKIFLAAVVVAGVGYLVFQHQRAAATEQRQLGRIASGIAGRPVHVHCQSLASAALDVTAEEGSVKFDADGRPSDTADLKRNTCAALGRFASDARKGKLACLAQPDTCPGSVLADAQAAHVLTHESFHLRGILDEGQAECAALGSTAWTARQLGASPRDASLVASYALNSLYPLLSTDYHSPSCNL